MITKGLLLVGTGLLVAGTVFVLNWLALIPWRKVKHQHWTENARVSYPIRVGANGNILAIPALMSLLTVLYFKDYSPPWICVAVISALAAMIGTAPMSQEIFPRFSFKNVMRQTATNLFLRSLVLIVFIGAIAMMPNQFNWASWSIFVGLVLLREIWIRWGFIYVGKRSKLFLPAPERLQILATQTSAQMRIPFSEILLMHSSLANALAFISSKRLAFSDRLLELCSDDELKAICAHELAHLSESKAARFGRSMSVFRFMPWLMLNPLLQRFGSLSISALGLFTLAAPFFVNKLSRKLESRADKIATFKEGENRTYANALTKIYKDGLIPAVVNQRQSTHPSLYDRLIACGEIPDFPRPKPAGRLSWLGFFPATIAGLLLAQLLIKDIRF